jgi:hypothetical protein
MFSLSSTDSSVTMPSQCLSAADSGRSASSSSMIARSTRSVPTTRPACAAAPVWSPGSTSAAMLPSRVAYSISASYAAGTGST